ncbi:MAG: hypothetical protein PSY14_08125 [bacterium]|nr:hypothetical protein [bacterium]
MPSMAQIYLVQIAAFALTQAGAAILGDMLFAPMRARRLIAGIGCIVMAAAIFYETAPR